MKRIKYLTYMLAGIFMLSACDKDETKVYITDKPTAPVISAPADNLTIALTEADQDKAFNQFAWTTADYDFKAAIQYQVQFSKNSDMSKAKVLSTVTLGNKYELTNLAFDKFLLGILKLTPNVTAKVYFRVVAAVSGLPASIYPAGGATTEIRTMTVTPFNTPIDIKSWGIVGSATPNGWNGPDYVMDDGDVQDQYEATVDLKAGEIKFRFNNDWGLNLGGTPAALTQGGANVVITEAGKYKITLSIKKTVEVYTGSYTITKL
jgi:hypothetical protein